jgi:diguanylate cyclase (GGDEF)-like protein
LLTTREVFKVSSLDSGNEDNTNTSVDSSKLKSQRYVTFQLPIEDKIVLETAMDRLKAIEQSVLHEFFYMDLNQTEIAKKLGISCNYVSHILRNSTKKLKKMLMTEEIRDTQMQLALIGKRRREVPSTADEMSVVDSVTDLYNKEYFLSRLDEEVSRAYRGDYPLTVIVVGLSRPAGAAESAYRVPPEDILRQAARVVKKCVRKVDVAGRLSDDVFALILPHTGKQAWRVCDRLRDSLPHLKLEERGLHEVVLDVKAGLAVYPEDASNSLDLLRAAADAAEISFKSAGLPERRELDRAA